MQIPFLHEAFATSSPAIGDRLVCAGPASIVLWADEGKKLLRRLLRSRTAA